jgi:hypothetical protein
MKQCDEDGAKPSPTIKRVKTQLFLQGTQITMESRRKRWLSREHQVTGRIGAPFSSGRRPRQPALAAISDDGRSKRLMMLSQSCHQTQASAQAWSLKSFQSQRRQTIPIAVNPDPHAIYCNSRRHCQSWLFRAYR